MAGKILITGATGNIGSEVLIQLIENGMKVRAAVHNINKIKEIEWNSKKIDIVQFDYKKPKMWEKLFTNIDQILLVAPPGEAKSQDMLRPFIDAAKSHNIKKIIMISALGVDKDESIPLRIIERHLESSGLSYCILRCNWFMQNFITTFRDSIRDQNLIEAPAEDGKISFVDTRDIAAVAVEVFKNSQLTNQIFSLTGSLALNFNDVSAILSDQLEKAIRYRNLSENEARQNFLDLGLPNANVEMYLNLYRIIRQGGASTITTDIKKVLNREPISFEKFASDFEPIWIEMKQIAS